MSHYKFKDVHEVFKLHLAGIKIDNNFYTKIKTFRINWMNKSVEYNEFLGSPLLGVYTVKFTIDDEQNLMYDILNLDSETEFKKIDND